MKEIKNKQINISESTLESKVLKCVRWKEQPVDSANGNE